MTNTLAKGGNAVLPAAVCRVALTSLTTGIDVSAVLLGQDGKVRSDGDLVFYNHPAQDGVALKGQTIVADLSAVPTTVDRIAVVASIDPELQTTHFDASNTPHAVIDCGSARITFAPPPLTHRETVVILIELYRRAGVWKTKAVGQGWDTGLAGLATDFGIVVDDPGSVPAQDSRAVRAAQTRRTPAVPPPPTYAPHIPAMAAPVPEMTPPRPLAPLGKVALTKAGEATIDMRKDDPSLVVTATLEWNGGSAARRRAGADLDLYALYVPGSLVTPHGKRPNKSDQVVYYRQLGSPFAPPYIALDGDSRVPGRDFTVPGGAQIRHVEKYSGNHVEARPTLYSNGNFRMSTGKIEFKTR